MRSSPLVNAAFAVLLFTLSLMPSARATQEPCTQPNKTALSYRGDGRLEKTYEALVTCPNITSLDLDLTLEGCVESGFPWSFQFKDGDRFPPLRDLRLSGYRLLDREVRNAGGTFWQAAVQNVLDMVMLAFRHGVSLSECNLERWLRAMDWTKLQDLRVEQEEELFYTRMKDELPSLHSLSLEWCNSGSIVQRERIDFIRSVPHLESLSMRIGAPYYYDGGPKNRTRFPLADILEVHGHTLRTLSLHQYEGREPDFRRPMLSMEDIAAIKVACPNLTHLGLDLDRDADSGWPNNTIDALLQIENMTTLTLGLEIGADLHSGSEYGEYGWNPQGLDGPGPFRKPRMSLELSETLFADLRARKRSKELRRAEFVVGDYSEVPYWGPLYFPSWEEGRARKFVCDVDATDKQDGGYCEVVSGCGGCIIEDDDWKILPSWKAEMEL